MDALKAAQRYGFGAADVELCDFITVALRSIRDARTHLNTASFIGRFRFGVPELGITQPVAESGKAVPL